MLEVVAQAGKRAELERSFRDLAIPLVRRQPGLITLTHVHPDEAALVRERFIHDGDLAEV